MADRKAGKVGAGRETRQAERTGGELQIKPEDCKACDELIAREQLLAKTASRHDQSIRCKTRHAIIPSRGTLRQSLSLQQGITTFLAIRCALWRAHHG
jgi:hypothetical protein